MTYPIENDKKDWDWIIWETEGNPDPKYQRGGKTRKLGLYSLNYDKLRKHGGLEWKDKFFDNSVPKENEIIGGGLIKIAVVESIDYSAHEALIKNFLPCFTIEAGKVKEPLERQSPPITLPVRRTTQVGTQANSANIQPPFIIMPYNYDDNGSSSKAIGTNLSDYDFVDAKRLLAELNRWASASRSSIAAFPNTVLADTIAGANIWTLRPSGCKEDAIQITGPSGGQTLRTFQEDGANIDSKYYSVKTGVQYVATVDQSNNNKDVLESNSIHAMHRSNLIAGTMKRLGQDKFEARYQIEILSILMYSTITGKFDGIQIREIGNGGADEVWFPALAIPSHGKEFAKSWGKNDEDDFWISFWEKNFAIPMGRAKAEMLAYFGMQHMTSNSQNFNIAFDRTAGANGGKAKCVILRDIGDTLYNNYFFNVLNDLNILYKNEWDHEVGDTENGVTLSSAIGGGYVKPEMTRIGASIVFFFPPFIKGDIDSHTKKAQLLAKWSIAHNNAFLEYMREKLGYVNDWSDAGILVSGDLPERLRKYGELNQKNSAYYPVLVKDILKLSPFARWELINQIKLECEEDDLIDLTTANNLVNAHEILICAEVECYIQSDRGKIALRNLHKGTPVIMTAPVEPVKTGKSCFKCKTPQDSNSKNWHFCNTCSMNYCNKCVIDMPLLKGLPERLRKLTEERRCLNDCSGITVLIK